MQRSKRQEGYGPVILLLLQLPPHLRLLAAVWASCPLNEFSVQFHSMHGPKQPGRLVWVVGLGSVKPWLQEHKPAAAQHTHHSMSCQCAVQRVTGMAKRHVCLQITFLSFGIPVNASRLSANYYSLRQVAVLFQQCRNKPHAPVIHPHAHFKTLTSLAAQQSLQLLAPPLQLSCLLSPAAPAWLTPAGMQGGRSPPKPEP